MDTNLEWTNIPFSVLGITLSTNLQEIPELNYDDRLTDMRKVILHWKRRNLTVLGKITVVKTILLSKFTYLFLSIPSPPAIFIKNLESLIFEFIWNGKIDRISRNQLAK